MASPPPPLWLALLGAALLGAAARAQDFDLSDALGDDHKPTAGPKTPQGDDSDFNLQDGLPGGHDVRTPSPAHPRPRPPPQPKQPGHSDKGFSDDDLLDVNAGGGGGGRGRGGRDGGGGAAGPGKEQPQGPSEGVIGGIVSSVCVALAGVVSGLVAYYRKKLCFKEHASV